jgi:hypothetical protein
VGYYYKGYCNTTVYGGDDFQFSNFPIPIPNKKITKKLPMHIIKKKKLILEYYIN